jgi:hypothetical protein|tara:strand:+ start:588 stop:1220 length:633 start_codon:yes stop_codon:yes gene_type:complete
MKYLSIVLSISVIYSQVDEQVFADQGIERTSEFKRGKAYGQDCDDTEYRDYKGYPAWKGYGGWISECDSIRTVNLDREFAEKDKIRQREKAIQDSIDMKEALVEIDNLDLDAMWENTVWVEITDIEDTIYGEVEQITAVAGVRGAEAEDEALNHLYYRRSMKGLALIDLQKAYGKLKIKRDNLIKTNPKHPKLEKFDNLLSQLQIKINKS